MRAVVFDAFGEPPTIRTVADPECPDDGVVVRVTAMDGPQPIAGMTVILPGA